MKENSDISNKSYDKENTVIIVNAKQAGLYIKNGIELLDVFWSPISNCLAFVFNKDQTKCVYDAWCKHELK